MSREAELKEVILDLQLLNRELQHDIRELQKEMNMLKIELTEIAGDKFLQVSKKAAYK